MVEYRTNIGKTTDTAQDETLLGYNSTMYKHIHNPAKCYPSLANGILVTGGVGVWTLGSFVELIPTNAITASFDIHWINFESASATDTYELVLYGGLSGNEIEIGRIRTYRNSPVSGANNVPVQIPAQVPNTRISAKLASATGGDNVTVSMFYHIY